MGKTKLVIVSAVLSGLIFSASLPFRPSLACVLALFGFLPVFWTLSSLPDSKKSFLLGYLTGAIYFLFAYQWLWASYPLRSLGIESRPWSFFLIFFVWSATFAASALFWGTAVWMFKKSEHSVGWTSLLIFPSLFTFWEYSRSYLLSVLWFSPRAHIGPHWTLGNLAYGFHDSFLALKVSSWTGIYGLTFLVAAVNVLIFIFWQKKKHLPLKKFLILSGIILAAVYSIFNLPWHRLLKNTSSASSAIPVAALQTRQPGRFSHTAEEKLSLFKTQLEALETLSRQLPPPKLIVLPEGSDFFTTFGLFGDTLSASRYFYRLFPPIVPSKTPAEEQNRVTDKTGTSEEENQEQDLWGTLIVDNGKVTQNQETWSKSFFLDTFRGVLASYDKFLLMPGGEYVPSIFRGLDRLLAVNSPLLSGVSEYRAGEEPPSAITAGWLTVGSLVCSDVVSPALARKTVQEGAELLVVQSSFGFTEGDKNFIRVAKSMMQFRAAENGRYLINASNFSPAYLINDSGLIAAQTLNFNPAELLTGSMVLKQKKTLYNKTGDGPIITASLLVSVLALFWSSSLFRFSKNKKIKEGRIYVHH